MATATYNRSEIFKSAWNLVKTAGKSLSEAMRMAWAEAKAPKVVNEFWDKMSMENKACFFKKAIQKLMASKSIVEIKEIIPETNMEPKSMLSSLSLDRFEDILSVIGGSVSHFCPLTGKKQLEFLI